MITMSLITPKPQLEQDLADKDAGVMRAASALHHAAAVLTAENQRFWGIPTERLLAVLNADLPLTLATFAANTQAGSAINALLDAVGSPELTSRAPVEPGRNDITFDGAAFVYTPPEEPVTDTDPEA